MINERARRWLILPAVLLGIAVFVVLRANRSQPEEVVSTEEARTVRFIEVPELTVVPRALGFGTVTPGKVWESVAEVAGKVSELHPDLKKGALIAAGEVLLRIDSTDYELEVARAETDIQATEAQSSELAIKETNTRASLAIEEQVLALGEKDLERRRKLVDRGTVTRSEFEEDERQVLAQRQGVQSLQNSLNLIPAERRLLQAQLARYRTQLETARRDLGRTTVVAPFTGRVAQVAVEVDEFVRQGDVLAVLDSIDVAEVAAQVPMARIGALIRSEITISVLEPNTEAMRRALGLSARVWLRAEGLEVMWPARVARMSDTIDPETRTVGVIVEVDGPYRDVRPGVRPPLLKGLFVEVELLGRARPKQLVIPRSALHIDQVYLLDAEDRLRKQPVDLLLTQPEFVVVKAGLAMGDRLIVSDLVPAVEGMLLHPVADDDALSRLVQQAQPPELAP